MSENQTYVASGTVYAALLDSNKNRVGGYRPIGNAFPFTMEVKLSSRKQKSAMKDMRGQIIHSGARIDEVVGSITLKNWSAKNIALVISGSAGEKTAESGTATAQSVTLPADGSYVPLGKRNVSAVTIADKIEGTDFIVDAELGLIATLGTSEETLDVDYSYAGIGGYEISIATNSVIRMALLIKGKNEDSDTGDFFCELDSVTFTSKSALPLISDPETDYEEMEFDLAMETLPGKTSPGKINGLAI